MKAKLKSQAHEAIRHGAAWFAAAGVSGIVFCWFVVEVVKTTIQ